MPQNCRVVSTDGGKLSTLRLYFPDFIILLLVLSSEILNMETNVEKRVKTWKVKSEIEFQSLKLQKVSRK
jgi:hypothetical protein